MIKIEKIKTYDTLLDLKENWDKILAQSESDNIFLTHEWVTTWWKHFGHNKELFVLVIMKEEEPIGIVPWMMTRIWRKNNILKKIEFIGTGLATWGDFILTNKKSECVDAVIKYLKSEPNAWTMIDMRNTYLGSGNMDILKNVSDKNGLIYRSDLDSVCPYFEISSDWESFHDKTFSKKTQRYRRRDFRRLQKRGETNFIHVTDLYSYPDVINKIIRLDQKKSNQKGSEGRSLFDIEELKKFMTNILSTFSTNGWLHIALLELDNETISYFIGFQYSGTYYAWTTAYDPGFAYYSPGKLLMENVIQRCFNKKYNEIDLLRGASTFKSEWTNHKRESFRVGLFRKSLSSKFLDFGFWTVRPFLSEMGIRKIGKKSYYNFLKGS